jgi:hypothetical protein
MIVNSQITPGLAMAHTWLPKRSIGAGTSGYCAARPPHIAITGASEYVQASPSASAMTEIVRASPPTHPQVIAAIATTNIFNMGNTSCATQYSTGIA